ncbi:MAG: TonB-dependent receptor [Pseudomonadales bacterium]
MRKGMLALWISAVFTLPLLLASPQAAQAAEIDRSGVIEEVIVTSRRRDESQQDVPLSVTAFGTEAIERLKPTTLRDFDGLAPNVYIGMNTAGPGASALFIRGVGYADIEKTQSPQVGVIVDGIQIGSSTGQLIDVFDVESIEVNRGPQGVLFGKNTIGGNIVVNRARPDFEKFGMKFSAAAGNYDSVNLKGRLNIPLSDTLALKLGAISRQRDGFYDNVTLNRTAGDIKVQSQTAALRWKPSDTFDATLTYDRMHDRSQIPAQDPRFDGDNRFVNRADKTEPVEYDFDQVGLRFDWDLSDRLTLHNITGWHDSRDKVNQDFDGGSIAGTASPFAQLHTLRDQEYEVLTEELRLSFAVNDRLDLMAGIYYFDSDLDFKQDTNNVLQVPIGLPAGVPCSVAGFRDNPTVGNALCQFPNARSSQAASEEVESISYFGSINWRPTDTLELALGARYIDEEKSGSNSYIDFSDGTFDTGTIAEEFNFVNGTPTGASVPYTVSDTWDDTIITASVNWAFSDSSRLYASYAEGFRSGGFSIRNAGSVDTAAFDPETGDQIEIGIKNDLFDNRLRANLAIFRLERDGGQFSSIIPLPPGSIPGTTTIINNGGKSTVEGVEVELSWSINEYFTLIANGGIIDVDNEAFSLPCEIIDGCVTVNPGVFDPAGTPRSFVESGDSRQPEYNYSTILAYNREWGPGYFSASAQYKKVGNFLLVNTGGGADQRLEEGGYDDVSLTVSYERLFEDGKMMKLTFSGKNLTDEEWLEQALFLGGPNTGFQGWGAPRTYAFEIEYSY